jgi:glycyl-tRNA synthetase beta chain
VRALSLFIKTPEGLLLRSAYKRSTGILEKGQGGAVQPSLLQETEEKNLYEALHTLTEKIDNALRMYDFEKVMAFLSTLKGPIDAFFEAITVNCDDEKLRQNRYALLGMFVEKVNRIANLSCLQ